MLKLNVIHIILFFIVIVFSRKPNSNNKANTFDLIRESFDVFDSKHFKHNWLLYALTLLPIYFYIHKPNIAEHVCVVYVYVLCIRTLQNIINTSNTPVNYFLPFFILSILNLIQHKTINSIYNAYIVMLIYCIYTLYNREKETTTSISNDVILSHLLFFIFRMH